MTSQPILAVDPARALAELHGLSDRDFAYAMRLVLSASMQGGAIRANGAHLRKCCGWHKDTGAGWEEFASKMADLFVIGQYEWCLREDIFASLVNPDTYEPVERHLVPREAPAPPAPAVPHKPRKKVLVRPPRPAEGATLREKILDAMGADPLSGMMANGRRIGTERDCAEMARWQRDLKLSDEEILSVIREVVGRRSGAGEMPGSFRYFAKPMEERAASRGSGAAARGPSSSGKSFFDYFGPKEGDLKEAALAALNEKRKFLRDCSGGYFETDGGVFVPEDLAFRWRAAGEQERREIEDISAANLEERSRWESLSTEEQVEEMKDIARARLAGNVQI